MTRLESPSLPAQSRVSLLLIPPRFHALSDDNPAVRESAWEQFYPRARAIASGKLRRHFGLRVGLDDQDLEDVLDAAIGILFRRCLLAPRDKPVRHPYALLVSISMHLLPKQWKQRQREREAAEHIARCGRKFFENSANGCYERDSNVRTRTFAHWLLVQLDKSLHTMPKEIRAGMLGTLFHEAGRNNALEATLATLPKARRCISRLYHVDGVAASQIALKTSCGAPNVSNSLRRCWFVFNTSPLFRRALEQIADDPCIAPRKLDRFITEG